MSQPGKRTKHLPLPVSCFFPATYTHYFPVQCASEACRQESCFGSSAHRPPLLLSHLLDQANFSGVTCRSPEISDGAGILTALRCASLRSSPLQTKMKVCFGPTDDFGYPGGKFFGAALLDSLELVLVLHAENLDALWVQMESPELLHPQHCTKRAQLVLSSSDSTTASA